MKPLRVEFTYRSYNPDYVHPPSILEDAQEFCVYMTTVTATGYQPIPAWLTKTLCGTFVAAHSRGITALGDDGQFYEVCTADVRLIQKPKRKTK